VKFGAKLTIPLFFGSRQKAVSNITWERRHEAFKAIWEKLDALTKALESIAQDTLRVKSV